LPGHKLPEEPVMPSVLSIDLLARRPEVEANRRGVVAAADQVDVARAGFYPDIGITALAGQSTLQLGQFLSPGSRIWNVGPALHLPLFEGGRLHATLGVAQAELDQAIAAYNQSVIDAVQQAATAFAQWAGADRQVRQAEAALEQARRLAALQRGRLDGGLADRSASLQAELAVLSGEEVLLDLRGRRLAYNIALQVALGGGYRAPLPSAEPNNPAMSP
jgi:outer membrane protein TolC